MDSRLIILLCSLLYINVVSSDVGNSLPELFSGFYFGMSIDNIKAKRKVIDTTEYNSDGVSLMEEVNSPNSIFRSVSYNVHDNVIVGLTLTIKAEYSGEPKFNEYVADGMARWGKPVDAFLQETEVKKRKISDKTVVQWETNEDFVEVSFSKDVLKSINSLSVSILKKNYHDLIEKKYQYDLSKMVEINKSSINKTINSGVFPVKNDNLYKLP